MILAGLSWKASAAIPTPELKSAQAVPVQYYLSLPSGWNTSAQWPVVVTVDGSGHNFLGNCQQFIQARKDRPFIIVTPCISSNESNFPSTAFNAQRDAAQKQATDAGYQNVTRTMVEGAGHGPFPQEVLTFFSTLLPH